MRGAECADGADAGVVTAGRLRSECFAMAPIPFLVVARGEAGGQSLRRLSGRIVAGIIVWVRGDAMTRDTHGLPLARSARQRKYALTPFTKRGMRGGGLQHGSSKRTMFLLLGRRGTKWRIA